MRVIMEEEMLGVLSREDALKKAQAEGLDLVEVSPNATPPVCKIIDYGKYLYQLKKQEQKNKSKQHVTEVKGIRLSIRISPHDMEVRQNKAREFISDRDKVKVTIIMRGREQAFAEKGLEKLKAFAESMQDVSKPEEPPRRQGNTLHVTLIPK